MSTELIKGWKTLTQKIKFDRVAHLAADELTDDQTKIIDAVKKIIQENIAGDVKVFGGKVNEEEITKLQEEIKKELAADEFKSIAKKMDKVVENWIDVWKKAVEQTCVAFLPVKDMPFPNVTFVNAPMVLEDKKGKMQFELHEDSILFCVEIACVVNRTVLYAKVPKEEPLFAPLIGEIDFGDFKLDADQKGSLSQNLAYIFTLADSLDSTSSKNNVTRYDAQYQRHGEPICDFFMKDEELMKAMVKITSALDSKRVSSGAAVCCTVVQGNNNSIVLVHSEKQEYEEAFSACLKLSAACYDSPQVRKPSAATEMAEEMTAAAPRPPGGTGVPGLMPTAPAGPAAPSLPVWTEEELEKESATRGDPTAGMAMWSESELEEDAKKRGLPTNMEYWTEEDLEKEQTKSHTLDIPEWKEEELPTCPNCGYAVRKGWDTCPVCSSPLGGDSAPAKAEPPEEGEAPAESPEEPPAAEEKPEDETPAPPAGDEGAEPAPPSDDE